MKKRYFISAFFTILFIILANKLWLKFVPMNVCLSIRGQGQPELTVEVDKKNNNFQRSKKGVAELNFDENNLQEICIDIKRSKKVKAVQMRFSNIIPGKTYVLSPLKFNRGKSILSDLEAYKSNESEIEVKDGLLYLVPQKTFCNIKYESQFKTIKAPTEIDFYMVFILTVLFYLLSLRLVSYLAEFKDVKNQSRIEILFLTLFFIFLYIPMSYIDSSEISDKEKRRLAEFKPLILEDCAINYEFGKNFNDWFNDRFFLRKNLIQLSETIRFIDTYWETPNVIKGKDGWLFFKGDNGVRNYQNADVFTDKELKKIGDYLVSIDDYCKKNNKKFYFVVCPDKSKVYGENYSPKMKKIRPDTESKQNQLKKYLEENTNIKQIYLYESLISHKKDEILYFKTDTHWNSLGAYYGFNQLISEMGLMLKVPDVVIGDVADFSDKSDLNQMLPKFYQMKNDLTDYNVSIKNQQHVCEESDSDLERHCENKSAKYKAVIYRDSFSHSLLPFFAEIFKTSDFYWERQVEKNKIKNADVVILEVVERSLIKLLECNILEND